MRGWQWTSKSIDFKMDERAFCSRKRSTNEGKSGSVSQQPASDGDGPANERDNHHDIYEPKTGIVVVINGAKRAADETRLAATPCASFLH